MADTTIDLLKNSSYIGKMDELIAAVKSGGGATSDVEWDNVKNKPTTIGGYGITDAKIDNGTITLGNQTITPLTSAPVTSVNSKTGAVTLSAADVSAISSTLTGTAGQVLTKTTDGQEWKDVDIPTALPNPNALTFTGAVTGTYDGSEPLTVEIPSGGGGTSGSEENLELIESMELSEDVGLIKFTGLNLSKVFIFFEIKGTSANGSSNVNGQININNFCYLYTNAIALADGTSRWLISEVEVIGGKKVHRTSVQNNNTYQSSAQNYGYFGDGTPIQTIEILPFAVSGRFIGSGSSIEIWGVQV